MFVCAQGEDTDRPCDAIAAIAEVFKLTDPGLLYLEVSTLVSKYPDIRSDFITLKTLLKKVFISCFDCYKVF